ncbi:HD-GYP domain-containing protein (c-di-GMP phosphodiesterase class II) [Lachnospiraceae bacterium PF1-22]
MASILQAEKDIFNFAQDAYIHCRRVEEVALYLGEAFLDCNMTRLGTAARLHDVGKVFMQPKILSKPGPLNEDERKIIDYHSFTGYAYLSANRFDADICTMVLLHHGTDVLDTFEIKAEADDLLIRDINILKAADIFDAITSKRPYRKPLDTESAIITVKKDLAEHPDICSVLNRLMDFTSKL